MSIVCPCRAASWVATLAVALCLASAAQAQLTTETLIGDSVANPDDSKYSDIGDAIQRFNNRDILGARTFLERAVSKDPKLPPIDVMLAKMHFVSGNGQAGLAALDAAVRDIRTDPEPYLLLADNFRASGQTIAAYALYEKGIEYAQAYDTNAKRKRRFVIRAHSGRAAVLQQWQDWENAEKDLRVWLEQDPDNANAHSRLGLVLFMLDRASDGYDAFVKAKELNKDLAPPYVAAATMYHRLGKPEQARQAFERAYAADKTDRATVSSYGNWLLQTDQIEQAQTLLAEGRKALPDAFELLLLSGLAARMGGDVDSAEQFFMQALALAPTNRQVYDQLAQMLCEQDDPKKKQRALEFARVNAQLNANNADVNITLAWVYYQLNRGAQANEAYQKGVRLGPLSPDSKYIVARLMVDQKRNDVAKQLLANADKDYAGIFVMKAQAEALLASLR